MRGGVELVSAYGREEYAIYVTMLASILDSLTAAELKKYRDFMNEWKERLDREEGMS